MKKWTWWINCLALIVLFVLTAASAPKPPNEGERFFYQEEVEVEGSERSVLWLNALNYATKVKKAGKRKAAKPTIEKDIIQQEGSFYVYTDGLLTRQIHGEINFKIKLEVSENSYKYTFSDFVFQFYQKNRYGQYAPISGKVKLLEEEKYSGMQEVWENHKSLARKVAENHIRVLKKEMQKIPPAARLKQGNEEERN